MLSHLIMLSSQPPQPSPLNQYTTPITTNTDAYGTVCDNNVLSVTIYVIFMAKIHFVLF